MYLVPMCNDEQVAPSVPSAEAYCEMTARAIFEEESSAQKVVVFDDEHYGYLFTIHR